MIYFGYGSNLNSASLRAKGVEPLASEPGILRGWKLAFSVTPPFPSQGGMATIMQSGDPGDAVHGVLHRCHQESIAAIDTFEARGIFYERVEVDVERYAGGIERAWAYVVLPAFLDTTLAPTQRYLNILLSGAQAMALDQDYVARLRSTEVMPPRTWDPFEHPAGPARRFNAESLAQADRHVALGGAVFDMAEPSWKTGFLVPMLAGKDATLFFLKMLDTGSGTATLDQIRRGELSEQQRNHVTGYMHEFAAAFRYAGRYDYD